MRLRCNRCYREMVETGNWFERFLGIRPYKCDGCGIVLDVYRNQKIKDRIVLIEVLEIAILIMLLLWLR